MKTGIFFALFALMFGFSALDQNPELKAVEKTILAFIQAGDDSNADELAGYLDDNYRVVMNRLFGSMEVSALDKRAYLEKIRSKEWGGDPRKVTINNLVINGNSATAQVSLVGQKLTFVSLLTLIRDAQGEWKLLQDVPTIQAD